MVIYVVERQETIEDVARKYGIDPQYIIEDNQLEHPEQLVPGQTLVIVTEGNFHSVSERETIQEISENYGINILDLYLLNPQIEDIRNLQPGDQIYIPISPKLGIITVNSYCYPDIDIRILREVLPHLTYLSIFNYQVLPDGNVLPIQDEELISEALLNNTAPKMVITNIDESGEFSSELGHQILADERVQDILLENILQIVEQKQYTGLDIDFEYLLPEDRGRYNVFIKKASDLLHSYNYTVSSAIAPKYKSDRPGLPYEVHDYQSHGEYLDYVILMTYEWGYTYGEPMAVAPLDQVRKVLDYAVTQIPSKKILMGIPNYGYDWTLPYVEGTPARTISNKEAVAIARRYGSTIQFNDISQAPYFYYMDKEDRAHVVWFEDARSIAAKLNLVVRYNLGGVSYWTVNKPFPQNWLVLESAFDIKENI